MDKFYSYADFLNGFGKSVEETQHEQLLNDIYLDLMLKRITRLNRIEKLKVLIDEALDHRDELAFYTYTEELLQLQHH